MFRKINSCLKVCRHTVIVLGLLYSGIIIILYYVIITRNTHNNEPSITKTTNSELPVTTIFPNNEHLESQMRNKTLSKNKDINGNKIGCIHLKILDHTEVPYNRSMFFIESSQGAVVKLSARQLCTIESAARINPDRLVFVLILGRMIECQTDITAMLSVLENYHNIRFRHIDLQTYSDNTPVQDFVRSGILNDTIYPVEKQSDMLRLLTLWKFGGIYTDLDSISLKPLPLIDFIGAENIVHLDNGVIGIQSQYLAEEALKMFIERWNGAHWSAGGPMMITALLQKICGTEDVRTMYGGQADCNNITVFSPEVLYPIVWTDWPKLFNSSFREYIQEKIKDKMSVHFWNRFTKNEPIIIKSGYPYEDIAKQYCPIVLSTVIDKF